MRRIPAIELYDSLDCDTLSLLITKIMREKELVIADKIAEEYSPLPYRYNHFIIIPRDELILMRVSVDYWYEPGVGLTYQMIEADRYRNKNEYLFYQSLYDHGERLLIPSYKLN